MTHKHSEEEMFGQALPTRKSDKTTNLSTAPGAIPTKYVERILQKSTIIQNRGLKWDNLSLDFPAFISGSS